MVSAPHWRLGRRGLSAAFALVAIIAAALAGRLALAGLEACGSQPTRECFLEAVRDLDAGGIDGFELDYGPEDNQGSDAVFITVMDAEGQFREVKELAR